jgi:hypothetical protein
MMKLVVWGTGKEVDAQLFDLTNDPDETLNLVHSPNYADVVFSLDASLQSVVEYDFVAKDVARYNQQSFEHWKNRTSDWKGVVQDTQRRWHTSWEQGGEKSIEAIEDWLSHPAEVLACRKDLVWPPKNILDSSRSKQLG